MRKHREAGPGDSMRPANHVTLADSGQLKCRLTFGQSLEASTPQVDDFVQRDKKVCLDSIRKMANCASPEEPFGTRPLAPNTHTHTHGKAQGEKNDSARHRSKKKKKIIESISPSVRFVLIHNIKCVAIFFLRVTGKLLPKLQDDTTTSSSTSTRTARPRNASVLTEQIFWEF